MIHACSKLVEMKQLFVVTLYVPALLWSSTVQKFCALAREHVHVIHHYLGDYPPLVAQLFGQWHRRPAVALTSAAGLVLTGSSVTLWNTTASVAAVCGRQTERHNAPGQRAALTHCVIFRVEMSLRLKVISYQPGAQLIWKERGWRGDGRQLEM